MVPWQALAEFYQKTVRLFSAQMDLVRAIRNARAEKNVEPRRRVAAVFSTGEAFDLLNGQREVLCSLARLDPAQIEIVRRLQAPPAEAVPLVVGGVEAFLPLAGLVDLSAEKQRLGRELAGVTSQIKRLEGLLAGPFAERAPAEVVARERERLESLRASRTQLESQREALG